MNEPGQGANFANLGDYNTTAIRSGSTISWIYMPSEHFFWYAAITGFRIGYNEKTKHGFTSTYGYNGKGGPSTY